MQGFYLYETISAMNLHFSDKTSYDYFKYHGKTRITKENYNKFKLRYQFDALAKRIDEYELDTEEVCYMLSKDNNFSYVMLNYGTIKKINSIIEQKTTIEELIKNNFIYLTTNEDLSKLSQIDTLYPRIFELYKQNKISIESVIVYDAYIDRILVDSASKDIISWPIELARIDKLRDFVLKFVSRDSFNFVMKTLV